jgi:hypothetical protein
MPIYHPMFTGVSVPKRESPEKGSRRNTSVLMSRVEYSWQAALQQSLLPPPRLPQSTKFLRIVSELPAGPHSRATVRQELSFLIHYSSVSRPAGLP